MIMTDANGYFSSASNYVKHSENTNTGQAESGIWFGLMILIKWKNYAVDKMWTKHCTKEHLKFPVTIIY